MIELGLRTKPSVASSTPRPFYISENGVGDGFTSSTPMSLSSFLSSTIEPGDSIFFNNGGAYVISERIITARNITVDSFGTGALPIIYGSTDISGLTYTDEGGGVYSTTIANLKWLYINQIAAKCGETSWAQINAVAASTSMRRVGTALFSGRSSFVGAKLIAKEFDFRASNVHTVTAVNTTTGEITFTPTIPLGYADNGMALKLFNQLQLLSANGDWYYDESISKLYVKAASNPQGTDIRAGVSDFGIYFNSVSDCVIQNVELRHYQKYAILAHDCPRFEAVNYTIRHHRGNGIRVCNNCVGNPTDDIVVDDNIVEHCGLNGIEIGATQRGTISRNNISYIGMQANIGHPFDAEHHTGGTGITVYGEPLGPPMRTPNNIVFADNNISFVGYQGIQWWGQSPQFLRDIIHDFCLKWNDGGGIHTVYRSFLGKNTSTTNGLIKDCVIYNCLPSVEGTSHTLYSEGIYFDNATGYFTVDNCTIYNVPEGAGIKGNYDSRNTTIINNRILNCKQGVIIRQDTVGPIYFVNIANILTDNIIASFTPSQIGIYVETLQNTGVYNPFASGGDSDRNAFIQPYGVNIAQYKNNGTGVTTDYTLAAWRTKNTEDAASTSRTNYITYSNSTNAAQEVKIQVNETSSPVDFIVPNGYSDHNGNAFSNPVSIPAFSSLIYFKDTAFP